MTFLVTLVAGWLGPQYARFAKPLLIGVGALLLVLALWGAVKLHDHRVVADHEAAIQKRAAPATDQAAQERANDTITQATQESEVHNAIAAQPDQPIAPSSRVLACERLRRAGKHPAACS